VSLEDRHNAIAIRILLCARHEYAPCGGCIEFASDMDRMDKSFKTRVWEKSAPHHVWILKFPGDAPDRH